MRKLLLAYANGTQEAEIVAETNKRYEIKRLWKTKSLSACSPHSTSMISKTDVRIMSGSGTVICIICEGSGLASHGVGSCPHCKGGLCEWIYER